MDVDAHGVRFMHCAGDVIRAEDRHQAACLGTVDEGNARHQRVAIFIVLLQRGTLVFASYKKRAARGQQRIVAETIRRRVVKRAACGGDAADGAVAIGLGEHGGGAPGGVIARHVLAFDQDNRAQFG